MAKQAVRVDRVSTGVFWVEIPDADLRIVCGCPADSVKHLIKHGFIREIEQDGVRFETGPNAILLSDEMVQNGDFANLAEFPVLQMLYRQGMLIPKHPNNTGTKPLLIGLSQQVRAQLQYIYRGNYGLVSEQELADAGMVGDAASDFMRLKLKFAFGQIRASNELLDTLIVREDPVEIRGGVTIRRTAANVFELRYKSESVTVDLNLGPDERYECPYSLGFQSIDLPYFGVVHSGEGDGWDIHRPAVSSIVVFQGRIYLIDAGPNLIHNLNSLGIGVPQISGIFHTHAHDDHFAGIATLVRAGHRIPYYAARVVRASVQKKLAALLGFDEDQFSHYLDPHDLKLDVWNDVDGLEVMPELSPHPVASTVFTFRAMADGGYRTYAHMSDIVSLDLLRSWADGENPAVTSSYVESVRETYLRPADVKKIDIGGGFIHGMANDFKDDRSDKIVLAHIARPLTPDERSIGASVHHGTTDVLIPARVDYWRVAAERWLQHAMPSTAEHDLAMLLNSEIVTFSPGSVVLEPDTEPDRVYLLLSGTIERRAETGHSRSLMPAGGLVGQLPLLTGSAQPFQYRALSYVKALEMPAFLYQEAVGRNQLGDRLARTESMKSRLRSLGLFAEAISEPVLSRVAEICDVRLYEEGDSVLSRDTACLEVVLSGAVECSAGGEVIELLGPGSFYGEESAVFGVPRLLRMRALERSEVCRIPGVAIEDIPVVRWKLLESYLARTSRLIHTDDTSKAFTWRDEFSVGNGRMDTHHQRLFEIANSIAHAIESHGDRSVLVEVANSLVAYTKYHFAAEEELMGSYAYGGKAQHAAIHRQLEADAADLRDDLLHGKEITAKDVAEFLERWLIRHILEHDLRYGAYLNALGVY